MLVLNMLRQETSMILNFFDGNKFCFTARLACLYGIIEPQLWLLITNNNQCTYVYWLIIFKIVFLTF